MDYKASNSFKKLTKTSGVVRESLLDYALIRINGAVTFQQELESESLFILGSATFLSHTTVGKLNSKGVSTFHSLHADEITNIGSLTLNEGTAMTIQSSGVLSVKQAITTDHFMAKGVVRAAIVRSNYVSIALTSKSKIETLQGKYIEVGLEKRGWSFHKKQLICSAIVGEDVKLHSTIANSIKGRTIQIGPNCHIRHMSYADSYTLHPTSKVEQIHKQ
ncbi:hypothetical protein KGF86_01395 [Ornithinibacillus massiliensis]|uniref:Auto-transporter adhesin head GIN domain-containing protein n=1 Tax=Ornithinibacillus massiliensis TaxID=1944633 RepID=A0ABS5M975_9BACI|nr:hypothetical protein [Ornithinibacillus massiliensis]MBS3678861.1 hypothetical protein [Ornithinibacillus massiliensis]